MGDFGFADGLPGKLGIVDQIVDDQWRTIRVKTIKPTRTTRLGGQIFPSIVMACSALVLWLDGTDAISLMPWLCLLSALITIRHILFEAKFPSLFTWFAVAYIGLFLVHPVVAPLLGIEIPGVPMGTTT